MGLRFDYLTRSPLVRAHLLQQFQAPNPDPLAISRNITAGGVTINALDDTKTEFEGKLDVLHGADPGDRPHEPRRGSEYEADQLHLLPRNRDTTLNRVAFVGYWTNALNQYPSLSTEMAQALVTGLTAVTPVGGPRERMDHWWDCTLRDGTPPTVICSLEIPSVARIFYCTPHEGAVEPDPLLPPRGVSD
jgi:hypothetical protein